MTNTIRKLAIAISVLSVLLAAAVAGASSAVAHLPPDDYSILPATPAVVEPAQATVHDGAPLWMFVAVALAAVAATLVVQALAVRAGPALKQAIRPGNRRAAA